MMAGNPNWWSMNSMHPQSSAQFVYDSNSDSSTTHPSHEQHHFPAAAVRSWSQLLLGGLGSGGEEEKYCGNIFQQQKKLENWEDQLVNLNPSFSRINPAVNVDHVKQEVAHESSSQRYHHHEFHPNKPSINSNWLHHHQVMPVSSPTSCITSLSNNILNFSSAKPPLVEPKNHQHNQDHSSECNSTNTGGVSKKARVQQSSAQPALKVRKEKLGDRITALHQLVSPFGKTDTASVLSEAIGYIRFLQGQIEALSSPYMRSGSVNAGHQPQHSDSERELRSRGLCLVPISCTQNVGSDINGADYWAAAALGGGGI